MPIKVELISFIIIPSTTTCNTPSYQSLPHPLPHLLTHPTVTPSNAQLLTHPQSPLLTCIESILVGTNTIIDMMRYIEERESAGKREREMLEATHKDFIAVMVDKHRLEQERYLVSSISIHLYSLLTHLFTHLFTHSFTLLFTRTLMNPSNTFFHTSFLMHLSHLLSHPFTFHTSFHTLSHLVSHTLSYIYKVRK